MLATVIGTAVIATMTQSAGDTAMTQKTNVDTATTGRRVDIGLGRLFRLSDPIADTAASENAIMTATDERTGIVGTTVIEETTVLDLVGSTETAIWIGTVTVATTETERILILVVETGMTSMIEFMTANATNPHDEPPPDDAPPPHAQHKTAATATATKTIAAIFRGETTTTDGTPLAGTAPDHHLALRQTSPTPKNKKKSDAASWQRCNPTLASWKQTGASALQISLQRKKSNGKPMTRNAQTVANSCPRCTGACRRIVWMSGFVVVVVGLRRWMRIEARGCMGWMEMEVLATLHLPFLVVWLNDPRKMKVVFYCIESLCISSGDSQVCLINFTQR